MPWNKIHSYNTGRSYEIFIIHKVNAVARLM